MLPEGGEVRAMSVQSQSTKRAGVVPASAAAASSPPARLHGLFDQGWQGRGDVGIERVGLAGAPAQARHLNVEPALSGLGYYAEVVCAAGERCRGDPPGLLELTQSDQRQGGCPKVGGDIERGHQ